MNAPTYAAGQTVTFYGKAHPLQPITTAHGDTLGHIPGQSVALYRDGFLQEITLHESAYDAKRAADKLNTEARRLPMPHLRRYTVI